jgi:protein TonB
MFVCMAFAIRSTAGPPDIVEPPLYKGLVWLRQSGGGGGGGGDHTPQPPRRVERPGTDAITVPVAKPVTLEATRRTDPDVLEALHIPALNMAAALASMPGAIDAASGPPASQGPGRNGGAGTGNGPGDGPGNGQGLGPGEHGGTDGGSYGVGNGVTAPIELQRGTPQYTTDAMRARIQGPILVECIVQTSGVCTDIHVIRSLEPSFGLDQEAIKATRQWRFRPGTRKGQPVPVRVTIEVMFTIR